jgi:hypothetical protein
MHPRFTGENLEKNKLFYERINVLASKHACTPSQLALAWLLHQGNDIIPIPGTVLNTWHILEIYFPDFTFYLKSYYSIKKKHDDIKTIFFVTSFICPSSIFAWHNGHFFIDST